VKRIRKNAPMIACVSILALTAMCVVVPAPTPVRAGVDFVRFNPPPFDFNDAFYTANGIDVNRLDSPAAGRFGFFRQTGPPARDGHLNWVVDNSGTDPNRKNIRILATTGGYIDDGTGAPTEFISIIAFVLDQGFFTSGGNARGVPMVNIVNSFEAYAAIKQVDDHGVFHPTPCASIGVAGQPCFSVASVATPTLRQDWRFATNRNPVDGSSPFGYFCDDLLGMWIITYFWYTNEGFGQNQTQQCHDMLTSLGHQNGLTLDGTPIIKTGPELNFLEGKPQTNNPIPGFLGSQPPSPACAGEGNLDPGGADGGAVWLICPAIPDPRSGGIAPDAFLDTVRKPNGAPLDFHFNVNFNCLKEEGQFPDPNNGCQNNAQFAVRF
jgi:hypothetical protein